MSNLIVTTVLAHLPQQKRTPSSWISFNAPCCVHNGEGTDTRKRGGIKVSGGNVSYHCFNCGYKTSYQQGRKVTGKFRKWLGWMGVADDVVRKLVIEALRYEDENDAQPPVPKISFQKKQFPKDTHRLDYWLEQYVEGNLSLDQKNKLDQLITYLKKRGIEPDWYDFFYSTDETGDFHRRVVIPFYWHGDLVGYTGRLFDTRNKEVKYWTVTQPGYVFNLDAQTWQRKYVIVTEGPFDAIGIDGVSILGSEINNKQRELIQGLNRTVIVVPDRDQAGSKLIDQAIEFNWGVSFPIWEDHIKDTAQAVKEYGRLYTLRSIITGTETNSVKIKLKSKQG